MTRLVAVVLALFAAASSAACTPPLAPLTAEMRREQGLGADELRRLQLYVSSEVTLRREAEHHGSVIEGGALRVRAGKDVDEVVIRERTPCVASEVHDDAVTVAFEDGSTLRFEIGSGADERLRRGVPFAASAGFATPPEPLRIVAPKGEPLSDLAGPYWLAARNGTTRYRGLDWQVVGDSVHAQLVVATEANDEGSERRVWVSGRRL